MDSRRISTSSSVPSISNLRHAMSARSARDKLPPALKYALDVLKLGDIDGLENHFLGTAAFLRPWSRFRDAFLLLQPATSSRASEPNAVRAVDILWFYTNFSDGELRYDPRADDTTSLFTIDASKYGTYDTTHWGVEEHEKMMYAWLLQEFKVGKARNPFGFRYFELQNVCTAWQVVFVPIVEAVRESYDPRGRRYYGRLARFVEERNPSRVAFPEGNVMAPPTANPYRVVTYTRERGVLVPVGTSQRKDAKRTATRKEEEAVQKELVDLFPKYGGVVEKPKNLKARMAEFMTIQKDNARRKKQEQHESKASLFSKRSQSDRDSSMIFMCRGIDGHPALKEEASSKGTGEQSSRKVSQPPDVPESPTKPSKKDKRDKKEKLGMVPVGMYGFMPSPKKDKTEGVPDGLDGFKPSPMKDKSPLHGITRQLDFPDADSDHKDAPELHDLSLGEETTSAMYASRTRAKPVYVLSSPNRKTSDGVYTSIRNSNPFSENTPDKGSNLEREGSDEIFFPVGGHPSVVPKPLFKQTGQEELIKMDDSPSPSPTIEQETRVPSYAGTGYEREISSSFMLSEIPEIGIPFDRQEVEIPRRVPWPGMTPIEPTPKAVPWPGQTPTVTSPAPTEWPRASGIEIADSPPPIPFRHPLHRATSTRSSAGSDAPMPQVLGPRIVSKENIRSHLRGISRDISEESLDLASQREAATMPVPTKPLVPYNSHMFPRRQDRTKTPVAGSVERSQGNGNCPYEMKTLEEETKE